MYSVSTTLKKLLDKKVKGLAGSIYLPTHPESNAQNVAADRTRLKNAVQAIRLHKDYDISTLSKSLDEVEALYDDSEFWNHQDHGLAILFDADSVQWIKLPFEVTEVQYLTDHFVVSPLLIMEAVDTKFYVLDINLTQPRLFKGVDGALTQINQDNMPGSHEDEVGKDEYQKQLQHQHGGSAGFHGHTEDDVVTDEIHRYLKLLGEIVDARLLEESAPLLLAGTDNRVGNLKKNLQYGNIVDQHYSGNIEHLNTNEIYNATEEIMGDCFQKRQDSAVKRLDDASPEFVAIGRDEILEIIGAETAGRIELLYLPAYRNTRDTVKPGDNQSLLIELPDDIETIEPLVTEVVRNGGGIMPVGIGAYDSIDQPKALCRY